MEIVGIVAMSADTESNRNLRLHYDHVITDRDREAVVHAINDQRFLSWLQSRIVDTIYLDDGTIIDVAGGDLRGAIALAMSKAHSDDEDEA